MRQIWTNCHLYNKKETEIDKVGRRAEATFQEKWAKSGFAAGDSRARRNNAGIAAPKYEPNEYSGVPEKKLQRRTSGSKTGRTGSRKVLRSNQCMCSSISRICFDSVVGVYFVSIKSMPSWQRGMSIGSCIIVQICTLERVLH